MTLFRNFKNQICNLIFITLVMMSFSIGFSPGAFAISTDITPQLPLLHEALEKIFNDLGRIQEQMFAESYTSVNTIRIEDSTQLNAWVKTKKEPGERIVRNDAVITTAVIEFLMKTDDGAFSASTEALDKGFARIAGVLAHELAHPFDNYDQDGIKNRVGTTVGSQPREIRADSEAVEILRKAGYPVNGLYMALSRLADFKEAMKTMPTKNEKLSLASMLSTHPTDYLRLSAQRFLLTIKRYRSGVFRPDTKPKYRPGLMRELQARNIEEQKTWQFVPPTNVLETLERMKIIQEIPRSDLWANLEYNRLLIALDTQLKTYEMTPAEEVLYKEIRANEINSSARKRKSPNLAIVEREQWSAAFNLVPAIYRTNPTKDHLELQYEVPYYSSNSYVDWVKSQQVLESASNPQSQIRFFQIRKLIELLPAELAFKTFENEIVAEILKKTGNPLDGDGFFTDLSWGQHEVHPLLLFEFMELYHTHIASKISQWNRLVLGVDSMLLPKKNFPKILTYLQNNPGTISQERVKDLFSKVWADRGFYGTCEFVKRDRSEFIDWELIFSTLGIEKTQGYQELLSATKAFTQSAEYADMLDPQKVHRGGGRTNSFWNYAVTGADLPIWADSDLYDYLAGEHNSMMSDDAKKIARSLPATKFAYSDNQLFQKVFALKMTDALKKQGTVSKSDFDQTFHKTIEDLNLTSGVAQAKHAALLAAKDSIYFQVIQKLNLPHDQRHQLLSSLFGQKLPFTQKNTNSSPTKFNSGLDWIEFGQDNFNKKLLTTLIEEHHFEDALEVLFHWSDSIRPSQYKPTQAFKYFTDGYNLNMPRTYAFFTTVSDFAEEILRDTQVRMNKASSDSAKKKILTKVINSLLDPGKGFYPSEFDAQTTNLKVLKGQLLSFADTISFSAAEKRDLFNRITGTGPTVETDQWALKAFPELQGSLGSDREGRRWIEQILEKGKIYDLGLQAKVASVIVAPQIQMLKKQSNRSTIEIDALISRILKIMPNGSRHRDQLLEKTAWQLDISGAALKGLIEDRKSLNWRRPNPILVNLGSAITEKIQNFSPETRHKFIRYLIGQKAGPMPDEIWQEIKAQSREEAALLMTNLNAVRQKINNNADDEQVEEFTAMVADKMRAGIERAIKDATPLELVPFIELVIEAGPTRLSRESGYPLNIVREFLHYASDSVEEKMLLAFFDVIEPHEQTVSLAYMLSHSGSDKSSIKTIFEVFQTFGVKFGQMASILKFLGPEIARETSSLKDNAEPMNKAEIEALLKMHPQLQSLKLRRILGSASIKTVVEVEYEKNGQKKAAVLALKRPDAASQVATNVGIARRFIRRLQERGVAIPDSLIKVYLEDLESQILEELQISIEAKKVPEIQKAVAKSFRLLKMNKADYRVSVPGLSPDFPVSDDFLVIEKADGIPLRYFQPEAMSGNSEDAQKIRSTLEAYFKADLKSGAKLETLVSRVWRDVSPVAGELSLRMGFRSGWFEADRHSGNFLVDPLTKTLSLIDVAQAEHWTSSRSPWKSDEMYNFARFLKGIADRDVHVIVSNSAALAGVSLNQSNQLLLEQVLSRLSKIQGENYAIEVINTLITNGLRLPRKLTLGALRELLIIQGEGYLSSQEFDQILKEEVTRIHMQKAPLVMKDSFKSYIHRLKNRKSNKLK